MPEALITVGLIALAGFAFFELTQRKAPAAEDKADGPWPFYVKKPMTQPEQVLYHRLVQSLPDHIILTQVQVSRVLGVKRGVSFPEWNNKINRLSYDFVVCAKDATVLAAIELDDKSHEAARRVAADGKKDKASADAGLRLIRWNVAALPDAEAIRKELSVPMAILGRSGAASQAS